MLPMVEQAAPPSPPTGCVQCVIFLLLEPSYVRRYLTMRNCVQIVGEAVTEGVE